MRLLTSMAFSLSLLSNVLVASPVQDSQSVQALADRLVDAGITPGVAIGVLEESGRVRTYCAGTLEENGTEEVTDETIFEIGSISKTFTTTLAHILEQQGRISLSDPVSMHLPGEVVMPVVDNNEIMLWHLATHTSGLPRMPSNFKPSDPSNPYADYTNGQLYEFLSNNRPPRKPGEQYEYSNLGLGLLGHALERNEDATYEELVQRHILKPLRMTHTGCSPSTTSPGGIATGHDANGTTSDWDINGPMAGAGDLNSNVNDMMKYAKSLLSESNARLHRSLHACQVPRAKAGDARIGLGWFVSNSGRTIWHSGGTGGFNSYMGLFPERNRAVVILTNSTKAVGLGVLGRHIMAPDLVGVETLPAGWTPDFTSPKPIDFDAYIGNYRSESGNEFAVLHQRGGLVARYNDQSFVDYEPIANDMFEARQFNARLQFNRDSANKVTSLTLFQNGAKQHFTLWGDKPM